MILKVDKLKKVYGKKSPFTAVDAISFDLKEGEILGLLGPNGSGKTTTIQMLLGTLIPTSGSIVYFGKNLATHQSEIMQSVSFASTYTSLPYILTIEENLRILGHLYSISNIFQKADPLLERFGILDKKKKNISSLSAGQITRLMLVKAFFTQPKVALLDEPTASLDPDISSDVCQFLLEQRKKTGLSILFTSHKMEEVSELCDRVIFLKNGKIISNDLPERLAKSISKYSLKLIILENLSKALQLADEQKLSYTLEHHILELSLEESEIPPFLGALSQHQITYSSIQIKEPSLEDYFLQIAEQKQ